MRGSTMAISTMRGSNAEWTMGIAAGGQIEQLVYPDPNMVWDWNRNVTSVISIQILNSIAFESITGMLTPPSPITLQSYLAVGFPFLRYYQEKFVEIEENGFTGGHKERCGDR
jgi:hypothetical protein